MKRPYVFVLGVAAEACYNEPMKVKPKLQPTVDASLISAEEEVRHLLEMFEFYLSESHLGRPVSILQTVVQDLRLLLGRLLTEDFLQLNDDSSAHFCATLTTLLTERAAILPWMSERELEYVDYVVSELLTPFEWAQEIKAECPRDLLLQRMIAVDIPLLDSFDFRLREYLRLVS